MSPTRTRSFNVLLTDHEYARLKKARENRLISAGSVLRDALRAYCVHTLDNSPCCADGTRCLVPHLHVPQPPRQPLTPNQQDTQRP
jgi:hypothetical protein